MGLDFFDITYRIEKAFSIKLSLADLNDLVREGDITVGDLYYLIAKQMQFADLRRYDLALNRQFWSQMQRVLHSATRRPLEEIELGCSLESLFPSVTRRWDWDALRESCPYQVPELDYPRSVRVGGLLLAAGVVLAEQLQMWRLAGMNWLGPLIAVLGVWMFSETYLKILTIFAPLRKRFPGGMTTVKDLCRTVLAVNYAAICREARIPGDERQRDVWPTLVQILAETLSVSPHEITLRSRIVRDLGAA